jgi:hypothetical protein
LACTSLHWALMAFRSRLLATLRAIRPVLEVEGVMVVGSELPNLLEPGAASTLVVSQDVDVAIPLTAHEATKGPCAASPHRAATPSSPTCPFSRSSRRYSAGRIRVRSGRWPLRSYADWTAAE